MPHRRNCRWSGFQAVAENLRALADDKTDPEKTDYLRSALSRYYYSAYHRAMPWNVKHGYTYVPGDKGSHDLFWSVLATKTGVPTFQQKGADQAHKDRVSADYGWSPNVPIEITEAHFEFAWENISKLHELIAALPPEWPSEEVLRRADTKVLRDKAREIWSHRKPSSST